MFIMPSVMLFHGEQYEIDETFLTVKWLDNLFMLLIFDSLTHD